MKPVRVVVARCEEVDDSTVDRGEPDERQGRDRDDRDRIAMLQPVYVGRLRLDPDNSRIHLWVSADNLRVGASANALAIATALWSEGYL